MKIGQQYPYHPYQLAKVKVPASCSSRQIKREYHGEDQISRLPVDIIVAILSLLPLQEAGRTSVLSRNWRHMWTFTTGRLNFDAWKSIDEFPRGFKNINSDTYVSRVNKVLELHRGERVDEFVIRFCMKGGYSRDIENWVKFAFEKGVKRFELDLRSNGRSRSHPRFDFPNVEKFCLSSNTGQGQQSNGHPTRTVHLAGFCSLVTLRLRFVHVTGEVIEHLLGNCHFLEQLQVISAGACLRNLKVAGSSLKLKCLEISYCFSLRDLEISAVNLVSLTYKGPFIKLLLKNVPVLSEFRTEDDYCASVILKPSQHLSYLHQLGSLKLRLPSEVVMDFFRFPQTFPELPCLKQLELELWNARREVLIFYTSWIKACPLLSTYTLRYELEGRVLSEVLTKTLRDAVRRARAAAKCHHPCLKVVELVGFKGHAYEVDLVSHLLEIAVSLDKLVVDPCSPNPMLKDMMDWEYAYHVREGRKRVWQLESIIPPTVNFVVL